MGSRSRQTSGLVWCHPKSGDFGYPMVRCHPKSGDFGYPIAYFSFATTAVTITDLPSGVMENVWSLSRLVWVPEYKLFAWFWPSNTSILMLAPVGWNPFTNSPGSNRTGLH